MATRNYKKEYKKFHSKPKDIAKRAKRNKDRKEEVKNGRASKPKKGNQGNPKKVKEVHHPNGVFSKAKKVISASKNRGKAGEGGRKKGVTKKQPKRRTTKRK
jgi:hypothetical protein